MRWTKTLLVGVVLAGLLAVFSASMSGCKSNGVAPGAEKHNAMKVPSPAFGDQLALAQAQPSSASGLDFDLSKKTEELWIVSRNFLDPSEKRPIAAEASKRVEEQQRIAGQPPATQPADAPLALTAADIPGSGQLMTRDPQTQKTIPIPLKHTDVKVDISAYIATVDVTQQYHNPYDGKIEAVYVFPLPQDAAVNEFVMTVGERRIRGIIREREEAEKIYNEAKRQGYVASLLTQERPNIFTQHVANIEPGRQIDINIRYFHTCQYVDGWFEFVFPMVVGPRFNPPGFREGVGAAPRGKPGSTGQATEVQYLRPDERSGHDISLSVKVDAGLKIEQIDSRNHRVQVKKIDEQRADVMLASTDSMPNKDFVLRYKAAGDVVKTALMTHRDEKGGYFTLLIVPPESLKALPRQPLEMVFTLDVSGSMSGAPITQSKAAITYALQNMRGDDTFQVVRFAGSADAMSGNPLPATPENVRKALKFIESTDAGGGTMMIEGIRRSLRFPRDESRLRFVMFLTDGYIGNEMEILSEIRSGRGESRLFSFGVGSSPNRYLLDGMARFGRGTVAYLGLNDDASKIMADYFERISHPAMTDLSIDFGTMNVSEVFPTRIPDLFVGRPVIVTGRFNDAEPTTVKVNGKVAGMARTVEIALNPDESRKHAGLGSVWARAKIGDLSDDMVFDPSDALPGQVRDVALQHGLMSAYTAFVAVDSSQITAGTHGTTVAVPVPVPDGVRYETTVPETTPMPR